MPGTARVRQEHPDLRRRAHNRRMAITDPDGELGQFLRSRRARLTPERVGIPAYGTRRVPGLRREELALLAGVSATYYT